MSQITSIFVLRLRTGLLCLCSLLLFACGSGSSDEVTSSKSPIVKMPQDNNTAWQLLDSSHGINGNAWQLSQCDACHLMADIHQNQSNIKAIVQKKGYQTCVGCHGDNGTELARPCLTCHNDNDLAQIPKHSGKQSHTFSESDTLQDKQCLDCHIASNMDGKFDINIDLTRFYDSQQRQSRYQDSSDFCLRCHNKDHQQQGFAIHASDYQDPLVAMSTNYQSIDFHGDINGQGDRIYSGLRAGYRYQSKVQCIDCHAMHGSHNDKLIIGRADMGAHQLKLDLLPPAQNTWTVTTSQGDSSQLCVLCHQMTEILDDGYKDTGNGLSGVHLTGQSCRSCHQHGMATQTGL